MVVALDDGVGQVLATLEANNLLENTLVFFLSDNGAPMTPLPMARFQIMPASGLQNECIRRGHSRAFRCPMDRTTAGAHCL
jgi:arylsulfatase A-like enzyme